MRPRPQVGFWRLVAATYFMVSGGPYGIEEIVGRAGYGPAIAILLITPLIWSLPTALMIGELAAAVPAEGGFYVWVHRALGPFWGFQEGYLSLVASIFDMAIYPTLFVLYLAQLWPRAGRGMTAIALEAGVLIGCAAWNMIGSKAVGSASLLLGALLLSPFLAIIFSAAVHRAPPPAPAAPGADLLGGILIAMWNYMGWDNASTIAGEVHAPARTYPRAVLACVAIVTLSYVLPVAAAWHAGLPLEIWSGGSWARVAEVVGGGAGHWLKLAVVAGGALTAVGMTNSLVMSYSRVPLAMAEDRLLPGAITRTLANGVPWLAVLACCAVWMLSLGMSFERLVIFDILLYGASLILEFVALLALRLREPGLVRPFRIAGGMTGTVLVGIAPTALIAVALLRNHAEQVGRFSSFSIGLLLMALGAPAYWMCRRASSAS